MSLIRVLGVLSLFYFSVAVNSQGLDDAVLRAYYDGLRSSFFKRSDVFSPIHGIHRNNEVAEVDEVYGYPVVQFTEKVKITGQTNDYAHSFFGIPYAKEPVRFKDPEAVSYEEDIDAYEVSKIACYQPAIPGYELTEDCLVLNVHVPASVDPESFTTQQFEQPLPVMVWIYGGGFQSGSATYASYDGRYLSDSTNTVVVSINYRLGPLGFLSFNEEDGEVINGNQGLKDQQLALKWVHDNIQHFGGDPDEITIFGESAGAQSVMFHMALESSKGYFKRAIMESNPAVYHYPDRTRAYELTDQLAIWLLCLNPNKTLECLRKKDASEIVEKASLFSIKGLVTGDSLSIIEPFRPVVDENFIPEQPLVMFQNGNWNNDVDVILGTNRQEMGYFSAVFSKYSMSISESLFGKLNYLLIGDNETAQVASERYINWTQNNSLGEDYGDIFAQEVGDLYFVCPTRALARFISSTSVSENTYLYSWHHNSSDDGTKFNHYSCHACEIPYVFNTGDFTEVDEQTMVEMFSDFWGSFAYSGIPTSEHAAVWPAHTENTPGTTWNDENMFMRYPSATVEEKYMDELCNFWDDLNLYVEMVPPKKSK